MDSDEAAQRPRVDLPRPPPSRARSWRRWIPSSHIGFPAGMLLVILLCLCLPLFTALPDPTGGNVLAANLPIFSPGHLLGTDGNGNDVLSRLLHGGRTSLLIACAVNLIGLLAGGSLGALSAYLGGMVDAVIMRVLDVLIAVPSLILVLAISQALPPSRTNTALALSFFSIPAFARVTRVSTLRLCEQPFMTAARLSGTSTWRMLACHVAPNVMPQLVAFGLLAMAITINIEGAASFLGLGVPIPQPSWGNMIEQGQNALSFRPSLFLLPGACLFLTVLSLNLLYEALRNHWAKQ